MPWFAPKKRQVRSSVTSELTSLESRVLLTSCLEPGMYVEPFVPANEAATLTVDQSSSNKTTTGVISLPNTGAFFVKIKCMKDGTAQIKPDSKGVKGKITVAKFGPDQIEYKAIIGKGRNVVVIEGGMVRL